MISQKNKDKKFRYKKEFVLKFACLTASLASAFIAIILSLISADSLKPWNSSYTFIFILGILFVCTAVLSVVIIIRQFKKVILNTDIKFRQMEKYNDTLRTLDKNRPFYEVLSDCLDYFNNSAEGEYSAKLLQKQAELDYMQSQINPHFLYNTLDSIRGQAINDGSEKNSRYDTISFKNFQIYNRKT